jgi:hypothetical protein
MRQVIFIPRSEMKENGVVGVDVRSVGWSFALPNGTSQLFQNVLPVPNAVILVLVILVCIEMNFLKCYVMSHVCYLGLPHSRRVSAWKLCSFSTVCPLLKTFQLFGRVRVVARLVSVLTLTRQQ